MFRSSLEERVSDLLLELGVSYEYESTKVPYQIQHNYTPDFVLPNGVFLETKGYWDDADRRKMRAVKKCNPELDIRMVFQDPYLKIQRDQRPLMPSGVKSTPYLGPPTQVFHSNG